MTSSDLRIVVWREDMVLFSEAGPGANVPPVVGIADAIVPVCVAVSVAVSVGVAAVVQDPV